MYSIHDSWQNQPIILYEAMVDFKGQTVPAIRVRMAPINNKQQTNKGMSTDLPDDEIPF